MNVLIGQSSNTDPSEQLGSISLEELLQSPPANAFYPAIWSHLSEGVGLPFSLDEQGVLIRTIEALDQMVIPHVLESLVLRPAQLPQLSEHSWGAKLYRTLGRDFYWSDMAMDCHATAKVYTSCAKNRIELWKRKRSLKLFPTKEHLKYVSIDILNELIRTKRGYKYLLVITDCFSKLTRTVLLKRILAAVNAHAFIQEWVYVYGPVLILLSGNGNQLVAEFFQDVCRILGVKNVFITTYHQQRNGQVEGFNRTLLAAFWHYLTDHPNGWDLYTDTLC